MIVEDEEDLRFLIAHNLRQAGHDVLEAEDGVQALEIVGGLTPDMIIADVSMPRMDGFELCRRVRDMDRFRAVPFLFLTARSDPTSLYKGIKLGASDFL
ncbi:MAG: response regulator, partial [Myxococcota bacterium]